MPNFSHSVNPAHVDWKPHYEATRARIEAAGDLPHATVADQIKILDDAIQFELGRFLLAHKGLNGYWTDYLISPPRMAVTRTEFESWLLCRCPSILATRERFHQFRMLAQERVREGVVAASIPCGLMEELLGLDYSGLKKFRLEGLDLDGSSLVLARERALKREFSDKCEFIETDAMTLSVSGEWDFVMCNGLNIYMSDRSAIVGLYQNLCRALKPGGSLITSFITPPISMDPTSPWKMERIDFSDIKRQRIFFVDVLQAAWMNPMLPREMVGLLEESGFKNTRVYFDSRGMMPTVVAEK